jgi:1-phosphatidylinositol-3-phosphate 5-kinase
VFCAGQRLRLIGYGSFDYQRELANLMNLRVLRAPIVHPHSPPPPATSRQQYMMSSLGLSSASSSTSPFKFFSSSHAPNADQGDSVWDLPEAYSAIVTRNEHPRDPTALLSLLEVLRHKVPVDSPQSAQSSSITVSRMANNAAPPSAWAKPAVEVSMGAVDGQVWVCQKRSSPLVGFCMG